jgi:hypothetical protein
MIKILRGSTVIRITLFAEEVFYSSSSPADFVNEVISKAPLHWQLLTNRMFIYVIIFRMALSATFIVQITATSNALS